MLINKTINSNIFIYYIRKISDYINKKCLDFQIFISVNLPFRKAVQQFLN